MKTTKMLILAALAFGGTALGQTSVTQSVNFSGVPDFTSPLVFNQYAGAYADLLGITISYQFTIQGGQFIVDNDADSPATVEVKFGGKVTAESGDVILLDNAFQPIISNAEVVNTATFHLAANQGDGFGDYDPSGPDGAILVGQTINASGSGAVNPLFWSAYAGAGTFTISAIAQQVGSLSYNSGLETASTPVNMQGTVSVTYEYIPEPSAVLMSALAGLGLALRRRRA